MKGFFYLSHEPCPNCGLPPGAEGHGAEMASAVTPNGREVYLLCRSCAESIRKGEPPDEKRIAAALAAREGAVPLPESLRY